MLHQKTEPLKVLNFDLEARPLGWYAGDMVHKEVTVACWTWMHTNSEPEYRTLGPETETFSEMITDVVEAVTAADMVVGHFIRGFDLPLLNSMCLELGLPPLPSKLSHDTRLDLKKYQGLSKSQENLAAVLGIAAPKVGMNQADWRAANRLQPDGVAEAVVRAVGDVHQNVQMYEALAVQKALGPPRTWHPSN